MWQRTTSNYLRRFSFFSQSTLNDLSFQTRCYQMWKKSNRPPLQKGKKSVGVKRKPVNTLENSIVNQVSSVLDDPFVKIDRSRPIRERGKLSQPLIKLPNLEEDNKALESFLESDGQEIEQIMNDTLAKPEFSQLFPKTKDLSTVLEFTKVVLNRDCSHADVEWTSSPLLDFYTRLRDRAIVGEIAYTLSDVQRFESRLHNLNDQLQEKEGKFRSEVVRRINFRRVPRIFIRPEKPLLELLEELKDQLAGIEA